MKIKNSSEIINSLVDIILKNIYFSYNIINYFHRIKDLFFFTLRHVKSSTIRASHFGYHLFRKKRLYMMGVIYEGDTNEGYNECRL